MNQPEIAFNFNAKAFEDFKQALLDLNELHPDLYDPNEDYNQPIPTDPNTSLHYKN